MTDRGEHVSVHVEDVETVFERRSKHEPLRMGAEDRQELQVQFPVAFSSFGVGGQLPGGSCGRLLHDEGLLQGSSTYAAHQVDGFLRHGHNVEDSDGKTGIHSKSRATVERSVQAEPVDRPVKLGDD